MPANRPPKRPTSIDIAVGRNVRIWRMARGLSQAQLAHRLGVTFQQVQKYEVGSNRIGTGRLVKAAAILGVPTAALLEGVDGSDRTRSLLSLFADRRRTLRCETLQHFLQLTAREVDSGFQLWERETATRIFQAARTARRV